jgi:hypothetical protein
MSSAKNPVVITATAHGHTSQATFTGSATVSQLLTAFGRIATGKRKITLELEVDSKMSFVNIPCIVTKADTDKAIELIENQFPADMIMFYDMQDKITAQAKKEAEKRLAKVRDTSTDPNGKLGLSERWTTSGVATKVI